MNNNHFGCRPHGTLLAFSRAVTLSRGSLSIFLVLTATAFATSAEANAFVPRSLRFARLGNRAAATEDANARLQEQARQQEEQARQRRTEDVVRRSRMGKDTEYSRHLESPFARNSRTENAWSSRNPWMAATHPSVAPRVNKSLWQRTGTQRSAFASQMKTLRSSYQVSSVHQMMIRSSREDGPHLNMLNAYARHGSSQHGAQMHGAQMHGPQNHGTQAHGMGVDRVATTTATTMSAGSSLFMSIKQGS